MGRFPFDTLTVTSVSVGIARTDPHNCNKTALSCHAQRENPISSSKSSETIVVVDEANPRCSMATDISALIVQKAFSALRAPIRMVTAPHTPVPFSDNLEDLYKPDAQQIASAVHEVSEYKQWETTVSRS